MVVISDAKKVKLEKSESPEIYFNDETKTDKGVGIFQTKQNKTKRSFFLSKMDSDRMITKNEARNLNTFEYPYPEIFITDDDLVSGMEFARDYVIQTEEKTYRIKNMDKNILGPVIILPKYSRASLISDYYVGKIRSKCKRRDEQYSPYDYWQVAANREEILKPFQQNVKIEDIYDAIYAKVRGCGLFKPYLISGFIKLFKAQSVLDFSSGWGDRLLGAMASKVRYVGVDPNKELIVPYGKMINEWADSKPKTYKMIESPFETADLKDERFDLIFTSPPYFDLEVYSQDTSQSTSGEISLGEWKIKFLYPSLDKAWHALSIGGHMCLIINDFMRKTKDGKLQRIKYVDDMIRYVKTLDSALFYKLISYADEQLSSPQPIWIWIKVEPSHMTRELTYHRTFSSTGAYTIKWGQLKLFIGTLRALLEYWNKDMYPKLKVVYAGAAHGYNIGILADMFGDSIEWHLYDTGKFGIKPIKGRVNIYEELFTNEIASKLSTEDNIFFFSDIRRTKEEKDVMEDMQVQMSWVKKMNPYRTSLKFRLPYVYNEYSSIASKYLAGDIMLQSFSSATSSETRLIIKQDEIDEMIYDDKKYESQMFYHNMVTRVAQKFNAPTGHTPEQLKTAGFDNSYDNINLIYAIDKYLEIFGKPTDSRLDFANNIINILGTARTPHINLSILKALTINSLSR